MKKERSKKEFSFLLESTNKMLEKEDYDLKDCPEMEVFQNINLFNNRKNCLKFVLESFKSINELQ